MNCLSPRHWHGIELESYFDGVAGFGGEPGRISPPVAARDSFEARFTPPRAGTFIYHAHLDEVRQQQAGLSGALLVIEPGTTHDPETDLPLLITVPRQAILGDVVLLNGTASPPRPAAQQLGNGETYDFEFIPTAPGDLRFNVSTGAGDLLVTMPIRVRQ